MKIIPIASGKGGVGKSLLAANLGVALAETGKKVVLADLDLGASNLHIFLGIRSVKKGIGTFLGSKKKNLDDIIIKTDFNNLFFIPGDAEIPDIANLKSSQKRLLIKNLLKVESDFLIIDLGAGTNYDVLDFFLISPYGIIITTPTLTSILNAYLFLKNAIFRILSQVFRNDSEAAILTNELKKDGLSLQKLYIPKLLEKIKKKDENKYTQFISHKEVFHPCLILNMLTEPKEADKATQLRRSVRQYLDLDIEHLGVIFKDILQDIALNARLPIIKYKPNSILSQAIYRIADKILQFEADGTGPLDIYTLDESYQIADIEAEADFQSKLYHIEEMLHCGELSRGDFIEIIKSQQFEIEKLKKESNLLKKKLLKAIKEGFAS